MGQCLTPSLPASELALCMVRPRMAFVNSLIALPCCDITLTISCRVTAKSAYTLLVESFFLLKPHRCFHLQGFNTAKSSVMRQGEACTPYPYLRGRQTAGNSLDSLEGAANGLYILARYKASVVLTTTSGGGAARVIASGIACSKHGCPGFLAFISCQQ